MAVSTFTVRAEDNLGNFADREFSIEVLNTLAERVLVTDIVGTGQRGAARLLGPTDAGANLVNIDTMTTLMSNSRAFYNRPYFWRTTTFSSGTDTGPIYRSTDGAVWEERQSSFVSGGLALSTSAVKVQKDGCLYTNRSVAPTSIERCEIYKSADNGDTWNILPGNPFSATTLPNPRITSGTNSPAFRSNTLNGSTIAVNPQTGTIIAVMVEGGNTRLREIVRSTDGGATWTLVQAFSINGGFNPATVYVENEGGVFLISNASAVGGSSPTLASPELLYSFDDGQSFAFGAIPLGLQPTQVIRDCKYLNGTWLFSFNNNSSPTGAAGDTLGYTRDFSGPLTVPAFSSPAAANPGSYVLARTQGRVFTYQQKATGARIIFTEDGVNFDDIDVGTGDSPALDIGFNPTYYGINAADDFTV